MDGTQKDTAKTQLSSTRAKIVREIRRIGAQGRKVVLGLTLSKRWDSTAPGLSGKIYKDYDTYRKHQALKLDAHREKSIRRHDQRFFSALRQRLNSLPVQLAGSRVLCLAARQGSEVRAFIAEGAFAVGIDLNPGRDNRYVMSGDFHDLQFADGTVDLVYTNSLDHAFDLGRLLSEVRRVLTPEGAMICEVGRGTDRGGGPGFYESLSWETVDSLLQRITDAGFELRHRTQFDVPWIGEQLVLMKIPPLTPTPATNTP